MGFHVYKVMKKKNKSLYEKTINENYPFYSVNHLRKIKLWKMLHMYIYSQVLKVKKGDINIRNFFFLITYFI